MTTTEVKNFPKQISLGRAGTNVIVRPLEAADAHELLAFFRNVPEEDRFYLKEDVTSPAVTDYWATHIDLNRVVPLVALIEGRIVADATLHRGRAGAHRHLGELRIVVAPQYRNQGLATLLLEELIYIAYDSGLDRVFLDLVEGKEDKAIRVAEMMGFTKVATLPGFARDITGHERDHIVLQLSMETWRGRLLF